MSNQRQRHGLRGSKRLFDAANHCRYSIGMTIGDHIRQLRKSRGWTQTDLADVIGVTRVTVTRLELGMTAPDFACVCKLADAFGVSTEVFRSTKKTRIYA